MNPRAFQNRPVDEDPAIVMVKMTHTGGSDTLVGVLGFTLERGTHQPRVEVILGRLERSVLWRKQLLIPPNFGNLLLISVDSTKNLTTTYVYRPGYKI